MPPSAVGSALSTLRHGQVVMMTGGATASDESTSSLQVFLVQEDTSFNKVKWMELPVSVEMTTTIPTDGSTSNSRPILDLGCLVHHSQVTLSDNQSSSTLAVIGGGVTSFAFGDSFAASYVLEVVLGTDGVGTDAATSRARIQQKVTSANKEEVSITEQSPTIPVASSSTPVVYVLPKDAKSVKDQLDQTGWLDKGFRMISVVVDDGNDEDEPDGPRQHHRIAIPIRENGGGGGGNDPRFLDLAMWKDYPQILQVGVREDMPLSTARYASHNNSTKKRG